MCLIVFELPDGSSSLGPRFTDPVLCLWSSPAFVCSAPPAMSHHQYRRRPMPDTDFRPSPGPDGLSERHRRSSPDRRGYYGSESGSSTSAPALPLSSMDSALSVLSSCGLEPADLALLAEIPEDKLTVESLPHIVRQIKSNREAPDPPPVSSFDLPSLPVERWHQYSGRVVEYPLDHIKPTGLPAEPLREWRDCWQNPRSEPTPSQTQRPARSEPPSQSPRYFAEAGPGKAAAATIPSLFSLAHRPSPADRSVAPPDERRWETGSERGHPDASASQPPSAAAPSKQEVQDFYSVEPQTYPTSCSLCNACVISLEDWRKHINSSRHADGQLGLLHRFPTWDCRKETPNRAERQSQVGLGARRRKDPETFWATNDGSRWQAGKSPEKKPVAESKSAEQARESVAIHKRRPPYVDEQRVEFSISNVFNIVKSSCVVSFTPPPQSNEDWSDLLRVVRRFGPIVYTLFGRSKACVEMKNLEDAEKLVNYYSSKHLRIKDNVLRVTFAVETSSLRTSAFAQRYQDESTERSRDEGRTLDESKKSRADHTARFRKARETDRKARSRSKSKSRDRKARSTSRERKTGSKDRSKSRDRKIRSRSRDRKARSKSSSSSAKMPEAQKPEMSGKKKNNNNKRRILTGPFIPNKLSVSLNHRLSSSTASSGASASLKLSEADAVDRVLSNMDADSVEDDSDIEGMAVVGEDLEDDRLETADEGHQKGEDCKTHGANKTENTSDEEVDLEDYIMLDEVGQEQSSKVVEPSRDCAAGEGGHGPQVSRVVYFKDLPLSYCNAADFVKLAKGLGRPVCYYLLRGLRKGFLELSCSSEAIRVVNELNVYFKDTPTVVLISNKYRRLRNGTAVHWDQRETGERTGASGRRDKSKSRDKEGRRASSASDQEKEKPAREKDFTRKTPDKESTSSSSSDILSSSKCENSKDVQSPSGKTQTKAESEKTEESQPEGMVPETPEDKPNTSDARTSDSKTTKNIADGKKTFEDKPDSENIHNVQTKVVEDKPQKGKSSSAQSNDSETTKNILEGKKTFENKLDSKNTHNVQTIVTKTPQNRSEGENLHNVKSKENKWDSEKNQAENASEGGNTHNEQPKDGKALQNLEGGKRLRNQPDNEMTLETLSEEGKITEVGTESKKTLEIVQIESEGGNGPKTRKRTIEKSESEKIKRRCVSTKTCEEGQVESGKAVGTTQKKCGENPERGSVSSKGSDQVSGKDPKVTNSPQEDPSGEEDLGGTVKRRASPDDTSAAGKIRKEEQSSETSDENQKNQEADGNSGAPTAPLHPIGIQFVRPVVGYFCNLCQLIYADEDEAKVQHCSSRQHHFNYWEKMKMAT
nr:matrin-3 isoform X10 [Syngnathus scovelli]XP_049575617.1 matrin-3 isoform X11 [Syngnathus scovelli]XP_049575701.1 matrin-3 isoform X12 [Syngnathus scovelli]XP_049575789.1 matrin-3 isoform X13 [Syngnathus scovelli]XP_049575957.1 matrin-3 isoform X15 [Syngnathus scovelli]